MPAPRATPPHTNGATGARHKRSQSASDTRRIAALAAASPTKTGGSPTPAGRASPERVSRRWVASTPSSDSPAPSTTLPPADDSVRGRTASADVTITATTTPTARLVHGTAPVRRDRHRRALSQSAVPAGRARSHTSDGRAGTPASTGARRRVRMRTAPHDVNGVNGRVTPLQAAAASLAPPTHDDGDGGEDHGADVLTDTGSDDEYEDDDDTFSATSDEDQEFVPVSSFPAQDWMAGGGVYVEGVHLRDAFGRTLQLRGVNLCGNSKMPITPHANNPEHPEFFDTKAVSFVNRPFPLADAHEHFSRLSHWGLTFVRLLVPWEALEHGGPGVYDEAYISYLIELCELMPQYGIKCFIDPHQDVWSRFSGGSGAPGWTFEVAGLDIRKFKATGAAHVHNAHATGQCDCTVDPVSGVFTPKESTEAPLAGQPPPMLWPTNYTKLASATMFTLFFAGATFAPKRMVNGENIQHFLQRHYCNAYKYLASRLRHLDAVIGFEVMNEPHNGFIGLKDLKAYHPTETLVLGDSPSAFQSFCLGAGLEQEVEVWVRSWPIPSRKSSSRVLNTERERAWLPGYTCPWQDEGIYTVSTNGDTAKLAKPDYFTTHPVTGKPIDFNQDCYLPFVTMYANSVQQGFPDSLVFVEPVPTELPPLFTHQVRHLIYAPHWYDLKSLFFKSFNGVITHDVAALRRSRNLLAATYFGLAGAKRNYTGQLTTLKATGIERVGHVPMIIGECGIPMDLNMRSAFATGDYAHHNNFLDAVLSAMEATLTHFTLWNYNPGNDHAHGDFWNGEDFSIFSPHQHRQYNLKSEERRDKRKRSIQAMSAAGRRAPRALAPPPPRVRVNGGAIVNSAPSVPTVVDDVEAMHGTDDEDDVAAPLLAALPKNSSTASSSTSLPPTPTTPFDLTELVFNNDVKHHVGGRVLDAVIRPYAPRIAGTPTRMEFDLKTLAFHLEFVAHQVKLQRDAMTAAYFKWLPSDLPAQCYETVIYVPNYHYAYETLVVDVSGGMWAYYKRHQTLVWRIFDPTPGVTHWLRMGVKASGANKDRDTCAGKVKRVCGEWCVVQ
ncbi:hypothetical protein AMAG_03273 [Allomyces macrogynus ATCC 38327]|uniref:Glycoside hydrolase family 5 C-terminal domain-containing protein n=1 Tax=Allomyces macrogynus (strain ATCC 38327) TaxID=578462 RepID=A0A0L0S593_ALLM3|nr:hypothetical protein AMAG_03273 [Allomyces macrogynus ATCC 38327]|eukprot:KNE57581.1 hypothetical protein AMAG_03273 [Allomyces macrogynus ATCC 38327]